MARRPLTFGLTYRSSDRTVRVRASEREPRRYLLEVSRQGGQTERREHDSLESAVRGFARAWRNRLH
jgi:hypothetical protein